MAFFTINELMDKEFHARVEHDRNLFLEQWTNIPTYRNYAVGKQVLTLTPKQKAALATILVHDFADNICGQIVAEAASRIKFEKWECINTQTEEHLKQLYMRAKIRRLASKVHYRTIRDGSHAVILGWDNDRDSVRMYSEPWWDGNVGTFIVYDDQGDPTYAVKETIEVLQRSYIRKRTVYTEDKITRWQVVSEGDVPSSSYVGSTFDLNEWEPLLLPGDENFGQWPINWIKEDDTPLNIPVIPFYNPCGRDWEYGDSDLAGGVTASQDQINQLQFDMTAAATFTAFALFWATGIRLGNLDPNTGVIADADKLEVSPGTIWRTENPDAKFGKLPPSEIDPLKTAYNHKVASLSMRTRTSHHSLSGEWPSGEALMRAEQNAVNKATDVIEEIEPSWTLTAHRSIEIQNTFGKQKVPEDIDVAPIKSVFKDPSLIDRYTLALMIRELGQNISPEEAMRIIGYDERHIERVIKEQEEKKESEMKRTISISKAKPNPLPVGGNNPKGKTSLPGNPGNTPPRGQQR